MTTFKERKLKEFRNKFGKDFVGIETFLAETIEEMRLDVLPYKHPLSFIKISPEYVRGWNAYHNAVEAKFEGKEEG